MIHNGNRFTGDKRSEESYDLIRKHLVTLADDGDADSLWCRFHEIINRYRDLEMSSEATWDSFVDSYEKKEDDNEQV